MSSLGSVRAALASVKTGADSAGGSGGCNINDPFPGALRVVRLAAFLTPSSGSVNIAPISGAQTIDSTAVVTGDRILLAGQTTQSENGIWIANTAGAWTRAPDWSDGSQMSAGTTIYVTTGPTWNYATLALTNLGAIVIGTTSLVFKPNGVNFDPNPALNTSSGAFIGVQSVNIQNNGTTNTLLSLSAFSEVCQANPINKGLWLGAGGYHNLADTTGWVSLRGAQGKMTGVPSFIDIVGTTPGHLALTPDLTNFKMYGFDGQPSGSWKCYGEAFTARKRGTNLTDANQTIQPVTDKASRYDRYTALTANRTTTLGNTGIFAGLKVTIYRHDTAAFTNAIVNGGGGGGTLFTFAASPTEIQCASFVVGAAGTDWAFVSAGGNFEYIEA